MLHLLVALGFYASRCFQRVSGDLFDLRTTPLSANCQQIAIESLKKKVNHPLYSCVEMWAVIQKSGTRLGKHRLLMKSLTDLNRTSYGFGHTTWLSLTLVQYVMISRESLSIWMRGMGVPVVSHFISNLNYISFCIAIGSIL